MKVLLIAPKDSPTYLNSLYASLRVQVGTCDLYALDDKQTTSTATAYSCAPCRRLPCCASNTTPRSGAKK